MTLKFNKMQYTGTLISVDTYFNIQLTDAEEIINGVSSGTVGDIFIRCNNVLYVAESKKTDESESLVNQDEKSAGNKDL